jgi:hypothetical protein
VAVRTHGGDGSAQGVGVNMASSEHLEIARRGHEEWNKWREVNEEEIDFTNHDFSQENICFRGFDFRPGVKFSGSVLPKSSVTLSGKKMPENVDTEITLDGADFRDCLFGYAHFYGCYAEAGVYFHHSKFHGRLILQECGFEREVVFEDCDISIFAMFSRNLFYGGVSFHKCEVPEGLDFYKDYFGDESGFSESNVGGHTALDNAYFGWGFGVERCSFGTLDFTYRKKEEEEDVAALQGEKYPLTHKKIAAVQAKCRVRDGSFDVFVFEGNTFSETAVFSGRKFTEKTNFSNNVFSKPPVFFECEGLDAVSLSNIKCYINGYWELGGIRISKPAWTTNSEVVDNLRLLRKIAIQKHDHDLEQDIFILERLAQRGVQVRRNPLNALPTIIITGLYGILSSFGKSLIRPIFFLLVSFAIHYSYNVSKVSGMFRLSFDEVVLQYTLGRSYPFIPFLHEASKNAARQLFGAGDDEVLLNFSDAAVAAAFSSFNILLLFLMGLAIRNYFKIK